MEMWKPIPGYDRFYEISNRGRVRSLHKFQHGRILSTYDRAGYPCVILSKNGKWKHEKVHRLMALAFIENPESKPWVHLIDNNPRNFSVDNLMWVTPAESARHKKSAILWREIISTIQKTYSPATLVAPFTKQYQLSVQL